LKAAFLIGTFILTCGIAEAQAYLEIRDTANGAKHYVARGRSYEIGTKGAFDHKKYVVRKVLPDALIVSRFYLGIPASHADTLALKNLSILFQVPGHYLETFAILAGVSIVINGVLISRELKSHNSPSALVYIVFSPLTVIALPLAIALATNLHEDKEVFFSGKYEWNYRE
jgi:hypothetical protein